MPETRLQYGDKVRHTNRPEWGIGLVVRTEDVPVNGRSDQRVSVRFPNAGLKRLLATHAELERVEQEESKSVAMPPGSRIEVWEKMQKSDWLGPLAKRKIEETMVSLPEGVRDPFIGLDRQLAATFDLYRFDRSGRGLIDWAVAQSGLADPLTRFTRQELEQLFDRWVYERDAHLCRLLESARHEPGAAGMIDRMVKAAPRAAREAVRRCLTSPGALR